MWVDFLPWELVEETSVRQKDGLGSGSLGGSVIDRFAINGKELVQQEMLHGG